MTTPITIIEAGALLCAVGKIMAEIGASAGAITGQNRDGINDKMLVEVLEEEHGITPDRTRALLDIDPAALIALDGLE